MPLPGPAKRNVVVRMDDQTIAAVDEAAEAEGLLNEHGDPHRSDWLRLAVAYALRNMPPGWRPDGWQRSRR